MPNQSKRVYLLALLLVSVLFAAQLHCCVDLSSPTIDSHVCPICSAAGAAIATTSLVIELAPAVNPLEVSGTVKSVSLEVPRSIAPRAPPIS